jgi:hypothetical protein
VSHMRYYSISVETWDPLEPVALEAVSELADVLEEFGALGASSSIGGLAGGVGATFGVNVDADEDLSAIASAAQQGELLFSRACEKTGIARGGIARLEVLDGDYVTREIDQPSERYAGVTELAGLFGVSRQRMSELRTRADFPSPVAELAAGPVWTESSVTRFIGEWERKPGRPRKKKSIAADA